MCLATAHRLSLFDNLAACIEEAEAIEANLDFARRMIGCAIGIVMTAPPTIVVGIRPRLDVNVLRGLLIHGPPPYALARPVRRTTPRFQSACNVGTFRCDELAAGFFGDADFFRIANWATLGTNQPPVPESKFLETG